MNTTDQKITAFGLFIWFIAALFFLYEFFLRTFVGSIAEQLIGDLHLTVEQFTYISVAYYIAYAAMHLPVGVLADRFGIKIIMTVALIACVISAMLFGHAHTFLQALSSRVLMGLGSSFAFVCLLVIVSNWFPKRFFGFFTGLSQFIGTMGPALGGGPLISWLSSTHISWRVASTNIGLFGLLLAILTLLFVKSKPNGKSSTMLFLAKRESIMVRLKRLLRTRQAWVIALYSASVYVSIAVMAAVWGTRYLQIIGLSQQNAAYMISIAWIAYAIGCPGFGFLSDLTKRRKPSLIIASILGVISTSLILYGHFHALITYEILFLLLGLAASGQNVAFAAIAEHASPNTRASAIALNNGLIILFAAITPVIISLIMSLIDNNHQTHPLSIHTLMLGLSILPLMYLTACLLSTFGVKETYCKPQQGLIILKGPSLPKLTSQLTKRKR